MGRRPNDPSFDPPDEVKENECQTCAGSVCFCGAYRLVTQVAPILFVGFMFGTLVHGFKTN